MKGTGETIENNSKEIKCGFVNMLLGALGASVLENMLVGKASIRTGNEVILARKIIDF